LAISEVSTVFETIQSLDEPKIKPPLPSQLVTQSISAFLVLNAFFVLVTSVNDFEL
jgi:hypothetical protein